MKETIAQFLESFAPGMSRRYLQLILNPMADRLSSQSLTSAGLVIKAAASALVKTGASAYYGITKGGLVTIAAATDMPALVGTVSNAAFNVYVFAVNNAGTTTTTMGTEGATLLAVKFPEPVQGTAVIGFVIINPTGTGDFVGGTTALDNATVVPNAAYVNWLGAGDPTILLGRGLSV